MGSAKRKSSSPSSRGNKRSKSASVAAPISDTVAGALAMPDEQPKNDSAVNEVPNNDTMTNDMAGAVKEAAVGDVSSSDVDDDPEVIAAQKALEKKIADAKAKKSKRRSDGNIQNGADKQAVGPSKPADVQEANSNDAQGRKSSKVAGTNKAAPTEHESDDEEDDDDVVVVAPPPKRKSKGKGKLPHQPRKPVKELFTPWTVPLPTLPPANPGWGTVPYPINMDISNPDDPNVLVLPQFSTGGPPARTTNAQTNPPLFEDRKWEFREGRYHKVWRPKQYQDEVDDPTLPDLDQEDNLIIPLMDMRPISKTDPRPKRVPYYYRYDNGTPKDWHNRQTIKALNDRRREAIWRVTRDTPFTNLERQYLTSLCAQFPKASILELAERFNYRFVGDYKEDEAFEWTHMHQGRTLESIRSEYITHKEWYAAIPPVCPEPIRQEGDKTDLVKEGNCRVKTVGEIRMKRFEQNGPKMTLSEARALKAAGQEAEEEEHSLDQVNPEVAAEPMELDDELAELAGWGSDDDAALDELAAEIMKSPEHSPSPVEPAETDLETFSETVTKASENADEQAVVEASPENEQVALSDAVTQVTPTRNVLQDITNVTPVSSGKKSLKRGREDEDGSESDSSDGETDVRPVKRARSPPAQDPTRKGPNLYQQLWDEDRKERAALKAARKAAKEAEKQTEE